ncbi:MAG: amino acid ABC transporter permease [Iamia sp.]
MTDPSAPTVSADPGGDGGAPGSPRPARRHRFTPTQRHQITQAAGWVVGVLLVGLVLAFADWGRIADNFLDGPIAGEQFPDVLTIAAKNTVLYTVFSFTLGLVLGLLSALARLSSVWLLRAYARAYVELFRGLPALLTIILIGFAIPIALGIKVPRVEIAGVASLSGAGILALGLVAGAYLSETIRAGLQAVPEGQTEAARSLGMSPTQTTIFVVIPQAFRIIIPPMANEMILLLKDTALLSVLGTTVDSKELTKFGRDGVSGNFNMTPLIVVGVIYVLITIPLTQVVGRLERRQQRAL